jgi:ABC-2 type transport system ATP-binding protein
METTLKISGLTVSYGRGFKGKKTILRALDLEIHKGEIFGLLGPNGAGKTTLIKSIIGLIGIEEGAISIFGGSSLSGGIRSKLGYMPEVANYYWFMTPGEILGALGALSGMKKATLKSKIDSVLELVGLRGERDDLVSTFSKGMQERLNIAQALLHDPEFLILDEPFSGLDPLGRSHTRNILKKLKSRNKTILLSSHELSEAELICDTVCVMRDGKVLKQGPLKALLDEKGDHSLETYFMRIIGEDA